jgi:hypothetical protein
MSLKQREEDYYKLEFIHAVLQVYQDIDNSLKDAFLLCFNTAKKHRIKHCFSPISETAWRQFNYYIKIKNLVIKKNK